MRLIRVWGILSRFYMVGSFFRAGLTRSTKVFYRQGPGVTLSPSELNLCRKGKLKASRERLHYKRERSEVKANRQGSYD